MLKKSHYGNFWGTLCKTNFCSWRNNQDDLWTIHKKVGVRLIVGPVYSFVVQNVTVTHRGVQLTSFGAKTWPLLTGGSNWPFRCLDSSQIFVIYDDAHHLTTKWCYQCKTFRNSDSLQRQLVRICMGKQDPVSIMQNTGWTNHSPFLVGKGF